MTTDKMLEYLCLVDIFATIPGHIKDEWAHGKRTTYDFGHPSKKYNLSNMICRILILKNELLESYAVSSDSKE